MARVLVIDDDPGTLDTFTFVLSTAGHETTGATSGLNGLALARTEPYDLILTDLRLPDLSGLELLAEVRQLDNTLPIVIITGYATNAIRLGSLRLGATGLADKPLDAGDLLRIVNKYVRGCDHNKVSMPFPGTGHGRHNHSATRWVAIVSPVAYLDHDVPTLESWAKAVGHSQTTLKTWCSNAGVRASDSLDLARAIRAVIKCAGRQCHWFSVLAIIDSRTLVRFLERAGLERDERVPSLPMFLPQQRFIIDEELLASLTAALPIV